MHDRDTETTSTRVPTLADLLRSHRIAEGLSQEQLAERAGLSASAVSALERGARRRVYRATVHRLVDALGLAGQPRFEFESVALDVPRRRKRNHESMFSSENALGVVYNLLREYGAVTVDGSRCLRCSSEPAAEPSIHIVVELRVGFP